MRPAPRYGSPRPMLLLVIPALAYETDQLTDRMVELADSSLDADAHVDALLARAIARTNARTRCRASTPAIRAILARNIYAETSHPQYVRDRGELAGLGYGVYAAWLETSLVARRTFTVEEGIYGRVRPGDGLVLGTVGVCSTVRLGGVLMGTDKPDHFWSQGYDYFVRRPRLGHKVNAMVQWGTNSERGQYGLLTSNVFSFADLSANWAGLQFYRSLLTHDGLLQRDADGCVVQDRPFRWVDWMGDAVDEVLNPSGYGEKVRDAVTRHLAANREAICAGYAVWGPAANARRAQIVAQEAPHVAANAPERVDEWQLDVLCAAP